MQPSPPVVAIPHLDLPSGARRYRQGPEAGGYRDSGADIAFALQQAGVTVLTPARPPDPAADIGWTVPDTANGISAAIRAGPRGRPTAPAGGGARCIRVRLPASPLAPGVRGSTLPQITTSPLCGPA
jgi:hypothetical protein